MGWDEESALNISATHCNDALIVQVRGDVDLATREVFEQRLVAVCASDRDVWLDLADVEFLDPQAARILARLQTLHLGLRVAAASAAVRRSAEIVELIDGVGTGPVFDPDVNSERDVAPR